MNDKPCILVVDDTPETIHILVDILNQDYRILVAKTGEKALEYAERKTPDLILLDVLMPGMNGYEVCRRLKAKENTRPIPLMFITVMGEEESEEQGFELGAVDYISKPFRPEVVKARIRTHLELKRHRDELEELVKARTLQLEQAKRAAEAANETKSRFLARISHELRTPMNGIIGMTDVLRYSGLDENQQDFVDIISTSADTLMLVLEDILNFSRAETHQLTLDREPFSLKLLFHSFLRPQHLQAQEKGLQLDVELDPALPDYVEGDLDKFRQILRNLLGNAIKFTETGSIQVKLRPGGMQGERIQVLCSIRDTGIGIPADKINYVFQSFSQLDESSTRKYGGLGLGLINAKLLIELMGGEMQVETEPGKGSLFSFSVYFNTASQ